MPCGMLSLENQRLRLRRRSLKLTALLHYRPAPMSMRMQDMC